MTCFLPPVAPVSRPALSVVHTYLYRPICSQHAMARPPHCVHHAPVPQQPDACPHNLHQNSPVVCVARFPRGSQGRSTVPNILPTSCAYWIFATWPLIMKTSGKILLHSNDLVKKYQPARRPTRLQTSVTFAPTKWYKSKNTRPILSVAILRKKSKFKEIEFQKWKSIRI